ncbi:MAG: class I SAM-dependent methyltransferase [Cytophagales bacterium]|nr:MAG: class I SAM-dependent methyltransferase [Cytophagales bacterium]
MYYWNDFINDINKTIQPKQTVFDAGAGDGHWRKNLPKDIKYISMDLGVGDVNVDYSHLDIKGDLRQIPLEDNSIDVIICIQVLEHLPEPWLVLKEFQRILKKGGFIYASCPQGEPQHQIPYDFFRYTKYGLKSIFETNGLAINFIIPQKGNLNKISNDITHTANHLSKLDFNSKLFGIYLKIFTKTHHLLFKYFDSKKGLDTNTIGHFIKANKI